VGDRVFIDVGGHLGETLEEAVKPTWRFVRLYVFEPASVCLASIERFADERVQIAHAGWGPTDATTELHDPGAIGASIHAGKALTGEVEAIQLVDAGAWCAENLTDTDSVWLKINCEGAECDVLDRLLDAGQMSRIEHLVVHFDVKKIPGMEHRADEVRRRLDDSGIEWMEAGSILFGRSHALRTANWLTWTEASGLRRLRYTTLNRAIYRARQRLYPLKRRLSRG
jgi:FkbM family methyltransferase